MKRFHSLASDVLVVGSFATLVKLAGAVKLSVTARYFGAGKELDAYLIAFLIPSFAADVLSGSIAGALIPAFLRMRKEKGNAAAVELYRSVLAGSTLLLFSVAIVLGSVCLAAPSFPQELVRPLLLLMVPILPVTAMTLTWRAVLNADGRFAVAAGTPVVTPMLSILLLFWRGTSSGAYVLALGTTGGTLLELAILAWTMKRRGYPILPRWMGFTTELRSLQKQYVAIVAGALILGGSTFVDQGFATLLGTGGIGILIYGTKLTSVLLAIGPTALGTVILPYLSELAANRDWDAIGSALRRFVLIIAGVTIPATLLLIAFSEPLVRLYLQHGAFSAESTSAVAHVQRFSLVQIPMAVTLALLMRLTASLHANKLLVRVALAGLITNAVGDAILMRFLGAAGIALSDSIAAAVTLLFLSRALLQNRRQELLTGTRSASL